MRLMIIRHADPDYANDTITAKGRLEAVALAEHLRSGGPTLIFSSPMGRARATAAVVAEALALPVATEDWTRELAWHQVRERGDRVYGFWDADGATLHAEAAFADHDVDAWPAPLDEPGILAQVKGVARASDAFLARLGYERAGHRYRVRARSDQRVAVFCHHAFGVTWLGHLLRIPARTMWAGFWLAPSSVTTILMEEREDDWAVPRCIGLGDCAHLRRAGLESNYAGLKANHH
jgi:probable phosphoglycerate mutase